MRRMLVFLVVGWVVAACSSDVVRPPDCIDCEPVEMTMDQTFEIELGSDRSIGTDPHDPDAYEWIVDDTGTMSLVSEEDGTRSEDPDEFVGGYSRYTRFTFEPTMAGATEVVFHYIPAGGGDLDPALTTTITVEVTG